MRFPHLVWLHISGGIVGILAGTAAMTFRKGSRRHALAGDVFVMAMLAMSGTGAFMALADHFAGLSTQLMNFFNGVLVFYLVVTGWATARRADGKTNLFDRVAFLAAFAVGMAMIAYGTKAAASPTGSVDGNPTGIYFFFGSVALLSAAGDIRMFLRGTMQGTQRIVRHLWRMSFAFLIAVFSFFLGQQKVFPASWRGLPIWWAPPIAVLVLMMYWFIRVRFVKGYKNKATASPTAPRFRNDPLPG
jgi:uncharacterized membrane protein